MKLQEKGEKMKSINESCLERNQKQRESKTLSHLDRKKAFFRQRIPESSCARKETADIESPYYLQFVTCWWQKKNMQPTIKSEPATRVNEYPPNTHRRLKAATLSRGFKRGNK